MKLSVIQRVAIGSGAALLLVLLVAAWLYHTIQSSLESEQWVEHSNEVLTTLINMGSRLGDAVTTAREYAATGTETDRELILRSCEDAEILLGQLHGLVTDNTGHLERLKKIDPDIHRLVAALKEVKPRSTVVPLTPVVDTLTESREKLRLDLREMRKEEQRLMQERLGDQRQTTDKELAFAISGSALSLFFLAASGYLLVREVRERTQAERTVSGQKRLLESILNRMSDGVVVADGAGRFTIFNPAAEQTLGLGMIDASVPDWSSRYGLYQGDQETLFPSDRLPLARAIRGESVDDVEMFVRNPGRADGAWLRVSGRPLLDEQQNPAGGVVVFRDISERKRAEEEKFRLAAESAPNGFVMINRDGHIVLVNSQAERLFGYPHGEMLGKSVEIIIPERFRDSYPGVRDRFFAEPQVRAMGNGRDLYGLRKDGSEFPVEVGLTPIRSEGELLAIAAVVDITERKRAEQEAQRHNEQLERAVTERTCQLAAANEELESFSYSVSHDLRAPLRAMNGFAKILEEDFGPQFQDGTRRYLGLIQKNAQQMGCLIDDLLAFSRLNRQTLTRSLVDPARLAREVFDSLEADWKGRDIVLAVGEMLSCKADYNLLRQVFANLLSNAIKFTRARTSARIEVGSATHDGQTAYFVRDNGVGFDTQYSDKLFRVFQRLHRVEDYEGTGVGLAIVQRIVARHGGRVWAESVLDDGATFYFTLGGDSSDG